MSLLRFLNFTESDGKKSFYFQHDNGYKEKIDYTIANGGNTLDYQRIILPTCQYSIEFNSPEIQEKFLKVNWGSSDLEVDEDSYAKKTEQDLISCYRLLDDETRLDSDNIKNVFQTLSESNELLDEDRRLFFSSRISVGEAFEDSRFVSLSVSEFGTEEKAGIKIEKETNRLVQSAFCDSENMVRITTYSDAPKIPIALKISGKVKGKVSTIASNPTSQNSEIKASDNNVTTSQAEQIRKIALGKTVSDVAGTGSSVYSSQAIADRSTLRNITKSTSTMRSGYDFYNTNGALVYPSDLLVNDAYNNSYTVIYISEHEESSILGVTDLGNGGKLYENLGSESQRITQNASKGYKENAMSVVMGVSGIMAGMGAGGVAENLAGKTGLPLDKSFNSSSFSGIAGKVFNGATNSASPVKNLASQAMAGMAGTAVKGALTVGGGFVGYEIGKTALKLSDYKQLNMAIVLPTPSISEENSIEWDEEDSAMSSAIMQSALNVDAIGHGGDTKNPQSFSLGSTVAGMGKELINSGFGVLTKAVSDMTSSAPALARSIGKASNTRKEQLFKDVRFRSFNLRFNMIARSVEDTNNIKKIIRVLKYHQYPELTMDNFLWIYPAEFDVVHYYRDKPNEYMPRHATSVLQEVSVNYGDGEDVMNLHYDGSPLNVGLELRFTEIVQLNKASILQGY